MTTATAVPTNGTSNTTIPSTVAPITGAGAALSASVAGVAAIAGAVALLL
jgi:hypothetical protein